MCGNSKKDRIYEQIGNLRIGPTDFGMEDEHYKKWHDKHTSRRKGQYKHKHADAVFIDEYKCRKTTFFTHHV